MREREGRRERVREKEGREREGGRGRIQHILMVLDEKYVPLVYLNLTTSSDKCLHSLKMMYYLQ